MASLGAGTGSAAVDLAVAEVLAPSPGALLRRRIFRHWGLMIGGTILGLMVLLALLAPLIAPYDPYDQQLARKLIPPIWHLSAKSTWAHPLGTDHLGRDYLSRLLYGAQISLLIGIAAMLISGIIGTTLGVLAGYFGGLLARRRHLGAGAPDLGPLRRGHAQRHPADAIARVRHGGTRGGLLHPAHPL